MTTLDPTPERAVEVGAAALASSRPSRPLPLHQASVEDGFWGLRMEVIRTRTIPFQRAQLERVGHLRALAGCPGIASDVG